MYEIESRSSLYNLKICEQLRPVVERSLFGATKMDKQIALLPLPDGPIHVRLAVKLIRHYRKLRPTFIGNRCVFDPSCSHYSEAAIRQNGLAKGIWCTIQRLYRCRPNNGGLDIPFIEEIVCSTK